MTERLEEWANRILGQIPNPSAGKKPLIQAGPTGTGSSSVEKDKLNMSQQRVSYQRLTASWDVLTEAIIHFYTAVFGHHLECCSVSSFPRHSLPNTRKMP